MFPSSCLLLLFAVPVASRLLREEDARGHVPARTTMPCAAPTRRAPTSFPKAFLDGFAPKIDFAMESGYM